MQAAACAVGRLGPDGPWVGFAPNLDDGYGLVVAAEPDTVVSGPASADELLALALAYFDETWDSPPDDIAATHGDIGALVRHVAEAERDGPRGAALADAVDAIDDGLAVDIVIDRLARITASTGDPVGRLADRAMRLAEGRES